MNFEGQPLLALDEDDEPLSPRPFDDARDAGRRQAEARARRLPLLMTFPLTFCVLPALLVVFQGRDASGKDGAIRKILEFSNIQNAYVHPFKVPTAEENAHDFLWRAHRVTPARGQIALFNRSHYEDVIAARAAGNDPNVALLQPLDCPRHRHV